MDGRTAFGRARRVVVKIGTGALTNSTGRWDAAHFTSLANELLAAATGRELVVVSSGAVAFGVERLALKERPKDVPGKQACAAVGQSRLMRAYEEALGQGGRVVAQVLLTHDDVQDRERYLNARRVLARLLEAGVVPIINENDTVATDELRFGDNDTLAALVAGLIEADGLIILSDVEGLYDADPRRNPDAKLIPEVKGAADAVLSGASVGPSAGGLGTGGMASKVRAASRVTELGIRCVVTSGRQPGRLGQVLAGEVVGTLFEPSESRHRARAAWIAHALRAKGRLWVDAGARTAVVEQQRSLLPSGISRVEGAFGQGEPVDIVGPDGICVARGLSAYSAEELRRIAGQRSEAFEELLGYRLTDEAIHRDDLVLLVGRRTE